MMSTNIELDIDNHIGLYYFLSSHYLRRTFMFSCSCFLFSWKFLPLILMILFLVVIYYHKNSVCGTTKYLWWEKRMFSLSIWLAFDLITKNFSLENKFQEMASGIKNWLQIQKLIFSLWKSYSGMAPKILLIRFPKLIDRCVGMSMSIVS
jgi:hypothetical protein